MLGRLRGSQGAAATTDTPQAAWIGLFRRLQTGSIQLADKSPSAGLPGAGALSEWLANTLEGPAKPLAKAMAPQPSSPNDHGMGGGDGHTTSGLDAAMSAHADKLHPVNTPPKK